MVEIIIVYLLNTQHKRALPNYIYQERDPKLEKNFGGRRIEWNNWNMYYPGFACRCAQKAKQLGYDIFGLQFYGNFLINWFQDYPVDLY